ncbi:MAG: hypothetical protein CSB34_07095 [Desulfobulbus propionicus]|nr:MAG: hypothetical protein CSB34_07095 [Desulfobulbus propionicus]
MGNEAKAAFFLVFSVQAVEHGVGKSENDQSLSADAARGIGFVLFVRADVNNTFANLPEVQGINNTEIQKRSQLLCNH